MVNLFIILSFIGALDSLPSDSLPLRTLYGEFDSSAVLYLYNLSWGTRSWEIYRFNHKTMVEAVYVEEIQGFRYKSVIQKPSWEFRYFPTHIRMGGDCRVMEGDVRVRKRLREFSAVFVGKLSTPFE